MSASIMDTETMLDVEIVATSETMDEILASEILLMISKCFSKDEEAKPQMKKKPKSLVSPIDIPAHIKAGWRPISKHRAIRSLKGILN
jgi:hypothetical protein